MRRRTGNGVNTRLLEWLLWAAALVCVIPVAAVSAARYYLESIPPQHRVETSPATVAGSLDAGLVPEGAEARVPASPIQSEVETPATPGRLISDRSQWSPQRLSTFQRLAAQIAPPTIGTLELPEQNSRIPIFSGVDESTMTLGAGHIPGTAALDGNGNIALTAHRDGAFRVLKDVDIGDPLVIWVNEGERRLYRVAKSAIVDPDRVDVLDPTPSPTLTLVTCYPFYFVGSAPQRYVLQATLESSANAAAPRPPVSGRKQLPHPQS